MPNSPTTLDTGEEWTKRTTLAQDGALPATAGDCARLCAWITREWADNTPGVTQTCDSWDWVGDATTGVCFLYTARQLTGQELARNSSPKPNVFASGGKAENLNQQNFVTSWKRSLDTGMFAGRYKRDLWVEERSEDWMKPDVILNSGPYLGQ